MVQYESSDVSQQATVQNGNKGGDKKGTRQKEKVVHLYVGIMTPRVLALPTTHQQMDNQNAWINDWNNTYASLSTITKMTGTDGFPWHNTL